ncbi:MAG: cytochrome c1 [Rickettsiaceae bacterium H1]|nr:cytochrome c1 [Rickettsiaceae bacterium H1]
MIKRLFCLLLLLSAHFLYAKEFEQKMPLKVDWPFEGLLGKFDKQTIQRGYKVYKEVCASCHSMNRIAFRNLEEIGFSKNEVKEIAKSYQVKDGPNDEGDMFERPGLPSNYFVPTFPNKQAAAAANNGAHPPDLSLIIKARHNGANYVYSLLTGYTGKEEGTLYENPYFISGKLSMSPPLSSDLVQYDDGTEANLGNMAYDVVNFLQWAAEPEMEKRKRMGLKVISFLVFITGLFIMTKRKIWKKVHED